MSLHWVNDLPGTFARVRRVLKPDGVFLASMCETERMQRGALDV
jgi:NADH dehydrogenase [ubiquinone] 1 alpha subcomplex assembly factor 5